MTGEKENRTKTKQKTTKHHMERTQNKGKGNDVTKHLVFHFIITGTTTRQEKNKTKTRKCPLRRRV